MNFTIVFPVTDLRRIYCPRGTYLERPSWLFPEVGKDFVRAFGGIKESNLNGHRIDGLTKSAIEPHLCDVKNGPKFLDLPSQVEVEGIFQWRVLARRLFFDQVASLRLEYDLGVKPIRQEKTIEPKKLIRFIGGATLQIRKHIGVRNDEFDIEKFGNSGRILAKAFLERTVPQDGFTELGSISHFVEASRPFVFMAVPEETLVKITDDFIEIENPYSQYFRLYHDRDQAFSSFDVPIWLAITGKKASERDVRNFSLYLRRCHSDSEVAKRLLNTAFQKSQSLPEGEQFSFGIEYEEYVRNLLKRIRVSAKQLRKIKKFAKKPSVDSIDISTLASVSFIDTNPGLADSFEAGLQKMRFHHQRNRQEVELYSNKVLSDAAASKPVIERLNMVDNSITNSQITNSNVTQAGGDVVNEIQQSFAAAAEGVTENDLKAALNQLQDAIQSALENDEVVNPSELAEDVASLTKEVTSEKPRGSRIAAIGGMIKDGVVEASKLIPSIVSAVEKLKSLF